MTGQTPQNDSRRLERQFRWIEGLAPAMRRPLGVLRERRWWIVRVPLAILLIIGGLLAFLPVLGLWMLPLGLLLLAVDIPVLRPLIAGSIVRLRRRFGVWRSGWARRYRSR